MDGGAFNLPVGYDGFLGVLNAPNHPIQEVDFTKPDSSGVDVSMTTPFTVQDTPEPDSIFLFTAGLAALGLLAAISHEYR